MSGVTFESVEAGVSSFPIMLTGPTAAQRAKSQAAAVGGWTIGVTELKPTRNAVHIVFSREDDLRVPGLEDALMRDLRMALSDGIDAAVFNGDAGATGTDSDITGLKTAAISERTITQTNKVKGTETLAEYAALVDGKHAESLQDLMVVASVGSNTLWLSTIVNSAAENQTLAQFLRASGVNWMTRADNRHGDRQRRLRGVYRARARALKVRALPLYGLRAS